MLVRTGSRNEVALANMESVSRVEGEVLDVRDVERVIHDTFLAWAGTIAGWGGGWAMYAWYDQMASQLRMSVCPARDVSELPFRCTLHPTSAAEVAESFVGDRAGIPWSELEIVEPGDALEVAEPPPHLLAVFAQFV